MQYTNFIVLWFNSRVSYVRRGRLHDLVKMYWILHYTF